MIVGKEFCAKFVIYIGNTIFDEIYNYQKQNKSEISKVVVNENIYIIINKNKNIIPLKQNSDYDAEDGYILFRVRKSFKKKNYFEIINPINKNMEKNLYNINNLNNRLWYQIKSEQDLWGNENEDYILNENDIIKIGIRKYEVIKKNINSPFDIMKKKNLLSYSISEINKENGSIFNIDLKPSQYIIKKKEMVKESSILHIPNLPKNIDTEGISNDGRNKTENDGENKTENEGENKKEIENEGKDEDKDEVENEGNDEDKDENKNEIIISQNKIEIEDEYDDEYEQCLICFSNDCNEDNPLLCLCLCKNYIHYECLKLYLSKKTQIHENIRKNVKTYNYNKFNCEVCLHPYPLRFRIPELNRIYELIDLNMPVDLDYIILESLDYIKESVNNKTIHIIQLNDKEDINIGRNNNNDVIDNHISVSRYHAKLKFNKENGKLYLENMNSKYGTLVLIKGNIEIKEKQINFQAGANYIKAYLEDKNNY